MTDQPRLQDRPNWLYLLRDYYELYRRLSAGGSAKIRSHQKTVREGISRVIKANAEVHEHEAISKPVTAPGAGRSTMVGWSVTRRSSGFSKA